MIGAKKESLTYLNITAGQIIVYAANGFLRPNLSNDVLWAIICKSVIIVRMF